MPHAAGSREASALDVERLSFSYRKGSRPTISDVTLRVPAGQTVALMGASGCGKTTLLKVLAGLRTPDAGTVRVMEGLPRRRGLVGYIPQQLGLVRNRTALENVLIGSLSRHGALAGLLGRFPQKEQDTAHHILERVGLGDKWDVPVAALSGGERQRVAIGRTILQRPAVLLADEFTANLDVVKAGRILDIVREATARGLATIVALHNVALAREYADRVLFMREGVIVQDLPASEVTPEVARGLLA